MCCVLYVIVGKAPVISPGRVPNARSYIEVPPTITSKMKFALVLLAFVATASAKIEIPNFGKGELHKDIQEFLDLLPVDQIIQIPIQYYTQDAEFQKMVEYFQSEGFKQLVKDVDAGIEYDAYRTDLEALVQATKSDSNNAARLEEAQASYEGHKQNFEKLRSDVSIKLKFLDENRVLFNSFYKLLINNRLIDMSFNDHLTVSD